MTERIRRPHPLLLERREILRLLPLGGVAFASGLLGCTADEPRPAEAPSSPGAAPPPSLPLEDFFFLQLSDTHWGYQGDANPNPAAVLPDVISRINAAPMKPDFVVFTGDLTHRADDAAARRDRMKAFRDVVAKLDVKDVRFLPGEHDAGADRGDAYRETFGDLHYAFDHKGVHFVAIDNVSDPSAKIGDDQLAWLERDLKAAPRDAPIVALAHRPLFDLMPSWDWATSDGARAIELLGARGGATVFFGHIHQELHQTSRASGGSVVHHAARSLVFPLPAPGSVPKKAPLAWNPSAADHGLGYRSVGEARGVSTVEERPLVGPSDTK